MVRIIFTGTPKFPVRTLNALIDAHRMLDNRVLSQMSPYTTWSE
jgi:methionyl-tRNA formyltransferase